MGVNDNMEEGREVWKGVKDARKLVRRLGRKLIGWPGKKGSQGKEIGPPINE